MEQDFLQNKRSFIIKYLYSLKELLSDNSRKIYTSTRDQYDTTIIEIKGTDNFDLNYFLEIDENFYKDGKITNKYKEIPIYILSYPTRIEIVHSPGVIKSYKNNIIYH